MRRNPEMKFDGSHATSPTTSMFLCSQQRQGDHGYDHEPHECEDGRVVPAGHVSQVSGQQRSNRAERYEWA